MDSRTGRPVGAALMALTGIAAIVDGILFFISNYTDQFLEIGIGPQQVNVSREDIVAFSPSLFRYISHLHVVVSGFEIALGAGLAGLAWYGVRRGQMWAWTTTVVAFFLVLVFALPIHYLYGLASLEHLGLNYLGVLVFIAGAVTAFRTLRAGGEVRRGATEHAREQAGA